MHFLAQVKISSSYPLPGSVCVCSFHAIYSIPIPKSFMLIELEFQVVVKMRCVVAVAVQEMS